MSPLYIPAPPSGTDFYTESGTLGIRTTLPRRHILSPTVAIATTGVMASYAIAAYAGDIITNLSFYLGTQVAVSPTNWWFALYDPLLNLIDQTADQTTTVPSAAAVKTLALSLGPTRLAMTGAHFLSIMFAAATIPQVNGSAAASASSRYGALITGQKNVIYASGAGLTGTAPSTISGVSTGSLVSVAYGGLS